MPIKIAAATLIQQIQLVLSLVLILSRLFVVPTGQLFTLSANCTKLRSAITTLIIVYIFLLKNYLIDNLNLKRCHKLYNKNHDITPDLNDNFTFDMEF